MHHVICDLLDPGYRQAIIKCLLDHGADVNAGTRALYARMTALHAASADIVPILLEHKPYTDISDNYGRTALQKAMQAMDWEKIRLLKEYGQHHVESSHNPPCITTVQNLRRQLHFKYIQAL